MKKLSLILSALFIAIMVVNLRVESKSSTVSNLTLANIHLLTANAEGGGTGCRNGCQSASWNDYCFSCANCNGQFGSIGIGGTGTC